MFRLCLLIVISCSVFAQRPPVIENEFVRVLDVTDSSNAKGKPHEHSMNRVMIYLTAGKQQLEYANGEKKLLHFNAGTPIWSRAGGVHTSQNVGGAPFRVIEVELKNKPGPPAAAPQLDPLKVAPANYKVEIDEPQARVIRARIDGKGQVPMHEHGPNRVVVFLTEGHLRVIDSAGQASELNVEPGTVRWSGAVKHREENLSEKPFEVIAVEVR